ncbi:MAG: HEAT repeat domain-containing protein [Chloroflexota bacterium]|nr:HEAT repeat domain-containing protein [Chloroflexota bacterium]
MMQNAMPYDDDDDEDALDHFDDEFDPLEEEPAREPIPVETVIAALRESEAGDGEANETIYYGLSGLSYEDIAVLRPAWNALDVVFRQHLLNALIEASESVYDLDYSALGRLSLSDPEVEIRAEAVGLLWDDLSLTFMRELMHMAQHDEGDAVRAAAVGALGSFILTGELGDLPLDQTNEAQALATRIYEDGDESIEVRRRALEALSNSSNSNVNPAIEVAYASDDDRLRISAVHGMGKSNDQKWVDIVLEQLDSPDPEMRHEAARAAGELQIEDAISILGGLIENDDRDIQEGAIWSLGEIGGSTALRILTEVLRVAQEEEDESLIETIEEAIASASLSGGSLLTFSLDD